MNYNVAFEKMDINRINKLNALTDANNFWDNVRKFTKNIHTTHALRRWEILADIRYTELTDGGTK